MARDELIKQLMPTFIAELEGHIESFERDLLLLEKLAEVEQNNEILLLVMRTAHSLKGASRSVSLTLIEGCCHKIEEVLTLAVSKGKFSELIFQLLFHALDALKQTSQNLKEAVDVPQQPLIAANNELTALVVALSTDSIYEPTTIASRVQISEPVVAEASKIPVSAIVEGLEIQSSSSSSSSSSTTSSSVPPIVVSPAAVGRNLSMRVQADKLDRLMVDTTELIVESSLIESRLQALEEIRNQINVESHYLAKVRVKTKLAQALKRNKFTMAKVVRDLDQLIASLTRDQRESTHTLNSIKDGVQELRLVTFATACQSFHRTVRDLAASSNKEISLQIVGGEVGIDRSIVDELKDPLLHLLRNAVDHGIETAEQRRRLKKILPATITLSAEVHGATLIITVKDDGSGLAEQAIINKAAQLGLDTAGKYLGDLIFVPGFSTAGLITEISGRGLGLDVVKAKVESINGHIEIQTEAGLGTAFVLKVPTSLTTARALLVGELGQNFAILTTSIARVFRISGEQLTTVEGKDTVLIDGMMLRAVSLRAVLGAAADASFDTDKKMSALLIQSDKTQLVLLVERLFLEREIVIKPLNSRMKRMKLFTGTTILENGNVGLIFNTNELVRSALGLSQSIAMRTNTAVKKRILIADDSITTRSMEKNILESAGYVVITASDGAQAWQLLQDQGADLIVSDVEMPNMDGFTFAKTVRASKMFAELPFILVTALAKDTDKARGIEVGATAYLVKSEFEQDNLLEIVRQLI